MCKRNFIKKDHHHPCSFWLFHCCKKRMETIEQNMTWHIWLDRIKGHKSEWQRWFNFSFICSKFWEKKSLVRHVPKNVEKFFPGVGYFKFYSPHKNSFGNNINPSRRHIKRSAICLMTSKIMTLKQITALYILNIPQFCHFSLIFPTRIFLKYIQTFLLITHIYIYQSI